jgi:hypothetical protein
MPYLQAIALVAVVRGDYGEVWMCPGGPEGSDTILVVEPGKSGLKDQSDNFAQEASIIAVP